MLERTNLKFGRLLNDRYLKEYYDADLIIDLSGDSFSDKKLMPIINILGIFIGIVLDKPIIYFSQSIGPFNKWWTIPLARFCLNSADLIIVREEITKNYLENTLKIISPIYLTADCAFLLPYEYVDITTLLDKSLGKHSLVGISASALLDSLHEYYIELMAHFIDHIIEKLDVMIIFIPHVISPIHSIISYDIDQKLDDRITGKKIYDLLKYKENIILIDRDYTPGKLKGLIKLCDIFIGGRMHANIAALSCCVPTMTMAWSHKYYGIMRSLGQEKYICDIDTVNIEELESKLDSLWTNRENVYEELRSKMEQQKELALFSGKLVKDLLISSRKEK